MSTELRDPAGAPHSEPTGQFPRTARERGKVAPVRFAHVVLRTNSRFEEMVNWYRTVLEAVPIFENERVCFMTYDEEHHRIAIAKIPALLPAPKFVTGSDHIAFTYADLEALIFTYRRLKAEGITPYWPINHGPTISLYYHDPDGNGVELQIDNFEDPNEIAETFLTNDFENNPVGEDLDFEELIQRYESGEPFEEIRKFRTRSARSPATLPAEHVGRLHSWLVRLAARLGKV